MPIPKTSGRVSDAAQAVLEANDALTSLGANPVDMTYAFRSAVESSLDVTSAILELCGNAADYSNAFTVTLHGKLDPKNADNINLTGVTVADNGCGMDHAAVFERFRGAFYNSQSHDRNDMSGRNGVGVKTNLQYWKEIEVETTTKGLIPSRGEWQCKEEHRDAIDETYRRFTMLHAGDPDTELRSYTLTIENTHVNHPWTQVPPDQSGTTVKLKSPRLNISINHKILLQRLSHMVEFLDKVKHPYNSIKLIMPNAVGKMTETEVKAFMSTNRVASIADLKGHSLEGLSLNYKTNAGTKKSKTIDPYNLLDDIEVDIQLMEGDGTPSDFVISICGANIYETSDRKHSGGCPTVDFLMRQASYTMSYGFAFKLRGMIKTSDERLKRALRHNKSALDVMDKYAIMFLSYIHNSLLKPLNEVYVEAIKDVDVSFTKSVQDVIALDLQRILTKRMERARIKSPTPAGGSGTPTIHHEYVCQDCLETWRVPKGSVPTYCCEFSITKGQKGCGSRDIRRNTHEKNYPGESFLKVKYEDVLGGFKPAVYVSANNTVILAQYHPVFITEYTGQKKELHDITVGIEQALFAIAIHKAETEEKGRTIQEIYGELLRCWYETREDAAKRKTICRKIWAEKGISYDAI